jgi:hypothetical protein
VPGVLAHVTVPGSLASAGFRVRGDGQSLLGALFVDAVDAASAAHTAGLRAGDCLLAVGPRSLCNVTHGEGAKILQASADCVLTLLRVTPQFFADLASAWTAAVDGGSNSFIFIYFYIQKQLNCLHTGVSGGTAEATAQALAKRAGSPRGMTLLLQPRALSGALKRVAVAVTGLAALAAACQVHRGLLCVAGAAEKASVSLPLGVAAGDVLVAAAGLDALGDAARALKLLPTLTNDNDDDANSANETIDIWLLRPDAGSEAVTPPATTTTPPPASTSASAMTRVVTAEREASHTGVISPAARQSVLPSVPRSVTLQRVNGRFGVSIANHGQSSPFFVAMGLTSAALQAGLQPYDRILQLNGRDVTPLSPETLVHMMVNGGSAITLLVVNDEPGFVDMARKAELSALAAAPPTASPGTPRRVLASTATATATAEPAPLSTQRKSLFSRLRQSVTSLGAVRSPQPHRSGSTAAASASVKPATT